MKGLVFNIQRFSVNDGPGIRTTVFLKGCPLHCAWCHNPESISSKKELLLREDRCVRCGDCIAVCKNNAIRLENGNVVTTRELCLACGDCVEVCYADGRELMGKEMTTAEVMREIEKDKVFFDQSGGGVTFSGGEPLLQHEFLLSLLQACKKKFIHTSVDTSGYVSPAIFEPVSQCVDLFLFDLKTLDDAKHREYTGVSNRVIIENLRRLAQWHKHIIVRIPVIPGINDDTSNVQQVALFVSSLGTVSEIHLLPYHRIGIDKYHGLGRGELACAADSPSAEHMSRIAGTLRDRRLVVSIGG